MSYSTSTPVVINVSGRSDGSKTNGSNVSTSLTLGQLGVNPNASGERPQFPSHAMAEIGICSGLTDSQKQTKSKQLLDNYDAAVRAFNAGAGGSVSDRVAKAVIDHLCGNYEFTTSGERGKYKIGTNDVSVQQLNFNGVGTFLVTGSAVWGA